MGLNINPKLFSYIVVFNWFYWWKKLEYQVNTTDLLEVIEKCCIEYTSHERESNSQSSVIIDSDWIGTGIAMATRITSTQLCHNDLDNGN